MVERILGKAEVGSSILPGGTSSSPEGPFMAQDPKPPPTPAQVREARLREALRANLRRRKAPESRSPEPDEGSGPA